MWETIEDTSTGRTARMKVPNGWIVRFTYNAKAVAMTFIPDSDHSWRIK